MTTNNSINKTSDVFSATTQLSTPLIVNIGTNSSINMLGVCVDPSGVNSVDWRDRTLYDPSNITAMYWAARELYDSSGTLAVFWSNRSLHNSGAVITLSWNTLDLIDVSSNAALNWGGRELFYTDGTTVVANWATQLLKDTSNNTSVDWNNRTLNNSAATTTVDWQNLSLHDQNAKHSVDWATRVLVDNVGSGTLAMNWINRFLYAADGTTVNLNWDGVGVLDGSLARFISKGLSVTEGSNAKQGIATLSAGTVVVSNTSVTANSRIFLTAQDNNSIGALRVSARTAGTSFTITSTVATDSGVVAYEIFEAT